MLRKDHPWWRWRNERSMMFFLASVCVQAYTNNIVYGLWRVMIFVTLVTKKYHPLNPSIILHKKHITNISTNGHPPIICTIANEIAFNTGMVSYRNKGRGSHLPTIVYMHKLWTTQHRNEALSATGAVYWTIYIATWKHRQYNSN